MPKAKTLLKKEEQKLVKLEDRTKDLLKQSEDAKPSLQTCKKLNAREQAIKSAVGDAIEKTIHRGLFVHRETQKHEHYKQAYRDYLKHGTPMPYTSPSFYTKVLRRI
jgi:hypothetical protein